MNAKAIKQLFEEYSRIREDAGADEVALAESALFIEDALDITLSDDEICQQNLGTHRDMERFVLEKMEELG